MRQGCILLPILLLMVLDEDLCKAIDPYKRGIQLLLILSYESIKKTDFKNFQMTSNGSSNQLIATPVTLCNSFHVPLNDLKEQYSMI